MGDRDPRHVEDRQLSEVEISEVGVRHGNTVDQHEHVGLLVAPDPDRLLGPPAARLVRLESLVVQGDHPMLLGKDAAHHRSPAGRADRAGDVGVVENQSPLGQGVQEQVAFVLEAGVVDLRDVRVLLVDDNATNRRILEEVLQNWGMRPTTADGGAAEGALGLDLTDRIAQRIDPAVSLPAVAFSFFDPRQEAYVRVSKGPFALRVQSPVAARSAAT